MSLCLSTCINSSSCDNGVAHNEVVNVEAYILTKCCPGRSSDFGKAIALKQIVRYRKTFGCYRFSYIFNHILT
jgi:hypothetical protein